jgi:hypothetical protein
VVDRRRPKLTGGDGVYEDDAARQYTNALAHWRHPDWSKVRYSRVSIGVPFGAFHSRNG